MKKIKYIFSLLLTTIFTSISAICASAASSTVYYEYRPQTLIQPPEDIPNTSSLTLENGIFIFSLIVLALLIIIIAKLIITKRKEKGCNGKR